MKCDNRNHTTASGREGAAARVRRKPRPQPPFVLAPLAPSVCAPEHLTQPEQMGFDLIQSRFRITLAHILKRSSRQAGLRKLADCVSK